MTLAITGSFRRVAICLILLLSIWATLADSKVIHLRNEPVATGPKHLRPAKAGGAAAHSGLFLIQFEGPVQPEWKAELSRRGVSLVRYVPDDAYVARGVNAPLAEIEALPFVRWTGAFRPEHKIHGAISNQKAGGADLSVSVLLAADAAPHEVALARGLMGKVGSESSSRFGRIWRGQVNAARLRTLAASDAVLWIERGPRIQLFDETASKIVGGEADGHATYVQSLGYDGSGVVVSVADSGLHVGEAEGMHPDLLGRVDAFLFYGSSISDASDEHSHGTHVAGIVAGNGATGETDDFGALWGLGVAPGAHLVVQRLFDGEGAYTPDGTFTFEQMTREAKSAGADVGSNSWGDDTQGRYDISAAEFDALVRDADHSLPGDQPYILEFSAGNAGPGAQTIGSPAVAKNVIATGASQNNRFDYYIYDFGQEAMADFSSRGPAEDGRIKPDVVAPGTWISSLRSPFGNDEFAWAEISFNYLFQGGTSQAGPHVSGAAAVFVQWYRELNTNATPSPALVKAAFINSAIDMDDTVETGPVPNSDEGWGRVDLSQIIGADRNYDFVDQSVTLATGQQYERYLVIADETVPLFVTLAYTDVPGFPGAVPALVNDLDLEVVAPDGRVFRGNQFLNGISLADTPSTDNRNNVECVFISEPIAGQWIMRVRARNVPQDARIDTPGIDQDFALVTSAILPPAGTGFVFFDSRAYTAPDTIKVSVVDTDLTGQPTVSVNVRSTAQPAGVPLVLLPSGIPGTFTGSVATVSSTTGGSLLIAHNDVIQTDYFDASASVQRNVTARGDLLPPVIGSVGTSNSFGNAVVFWLTDEPAHSVVQFGSNVPPTLFATNRTLEAEHAVTIPDLHSGMTYYYAVISEDEAGNRATNDNGGAWFSFVGPTAPTVLLVENYQNDELGAGPVIPVSVYTDALDQIGVTYDVWDMTGGDPAPLAEDLRPYRVVIWRISDNIFLNNTLSAAEQNTVQEYVQGGGSFLISSMELLTRIGGGGFVSNVLHVATVNVDATAPSANGVAGNVVTDPSLSLPLNYDNYVTEFYEFASIPADISDTVTATGDAFPILVDEFEEVVGVAYPRPGIESTGRVIFLSFPLDAVSLTDPAPNNRAGLLQRILAFLAPGQQGIGSVILDNTEYTLPSVANIEVADSDLAGAGQVSITVSSTSEPAGKTLQLLEIGRFGIFRGTLPIVPEFGLDPAGELLAASNDVILASYFDASRNVSLTFTARVETIAPRITNIVIEPGYVDALASWSTDERCDALVQFGESPLLGRTAYSSSLLTEHEVTLDGLQPDRLYYYRVVSRDNAGNVTMHDNNGALYTFHTLTPLTAPWFDDLEQGDANWSVLPVDESELDWEYGPPQNGVAPHSGGNVWGSNLRGEPITLAESFLISPPVFLTGGNRATLRFWHNYDFFLNEDDFINLGEVAIITNTAQQPITLEVIQDSASSDWEEAEYDLTPYVGQLVYIVWHYAFFSFETAPRIGWLIDDISITMSNVPAGTLLITNNLSQAMFTIAGPLSLTAAGNVFLSTNAPPGEYRVTFAPVPYYVTPAPQTNTLVAPGTTVFSAHYSIVDTNNNGMADAWEEQFFGSASPSRTEFTDTDQDGMTDFAEFQAGTMPTNSASHLRFFTPAVQNTGVVRLDWPTVPGRSYRLSGSSDLSTWQVESDWTRAKGTVSSYTTTLTNGTRFLRLEVQP